LHAGYKIFHPFSTHRLIGDPAKIAVVGVAMFLMSHMQAVLSSLPETITSHVELANTTLVTGLKLNSGVIS
jgi:hypothetical protein